jgi:hypothetical protein
VGEDGIELVSEDPAWHFDYLQWFSFRHRLIMIHRLISKQLSSTYTLCGRVDMFMKHRRCIQPYRFPIWVILDAAG